METIAIIGASRGLGYALAKQYIKRGNLILISRNEQQLLENKNHLDTYDSLYTSTIYSCDLSCIQDVQNLRTYLEEQKTTKIIYCAGQVHVGPIQYQESWESLFNVNMRGLTELLITTYQHETWNPKWIVVGSTARYFVGPSMSLYFASKHYVSALVESLQYEYPKRDTILLVTPGFINTDMLQTNANVRGLAKYLIHDVQHVAKRIVQADDRHKKHVLIGKRDRVYIMISRCVPKSWQAMYFRRILNRYQK